MKKLFLTLVLCCCNILAHALTLTGHVTTSDKAPLPYVSVYLPDLKIGATTDLDGNFRITNIPAGRHTLTASYVGYATQSVELQLDKDSRHNFTMEEQVITLDEVFITPNGESLERFILGQTVKHTRKMAKFTDHFDLTRTARLEQRGQDIKFIFEGHMGVINTFLGMMGYKTIFHFLLDNPNYRIEAEILSSFAKGKAKLVKSTFGNCSPKLTAAQESSIRKKLLERHNGCESYDNAYERLAEIKQELDKLSKKKPDELAKALSYKGKYDEGTRDIHIICYKKHEYHIIDGIWQIRRIVEYNDKGQQTSITEFGELTKDVFMPMSVYANFSFNLESVIKKELEDAKKQDRSKLSQKERKKLEEDIPRLEKLLASDGWSIKVSIGYAYRDFRLK